MAAAWRIISILLWCVFMHILGLYLFSKGFLLSRVQIRNRTHCERDSSSSSSACAHLPPPKFSKFVVVVVDALRYDFADYHASLEEDDQKPFLNEMPIFRRLESADPSKARLFEFVADPPTTTMQRLQGLTTGSLPTFVDIGANFDGYQIVEDNFLAQLNATGKSAVFMGDDTWTNLFPKHFLRQYPFPSFNVRDLHTVDNGVKTHIFPELLRNDWTVLIGHLLGVDHCGHRYGPDHPAMAAKLKETNEFIEQVAEKMDDNTLLVVMGDHGMTSSGDHGGDSDGELSSTLFLHAKKSFLDIPAVRVDDTSSPSSPPPPLRIPQIDLIPTISLLAGIPIPFSNLGKPILDVFEGESAKSSALKIAVEQVNSYLDAYRLVSDDIPKEDLVTIADIHAKIQALDGATDPASRTRLSAEYLETVRSVCERVWAKFDVSFIVLGLVVSISVALVVITLFCDTRIFVEDETFSRLGKILAAATFISACELAVHKLPTSSLDRLPRTQGLVGFGISILSVLIVVRNHYFDDPEASKFVKLWHRIRTPSLPSAVASVVVTVFSACAFSNSFVVSEDSVVHFAFLSVLWFVVVKTIVDNKGNPNKEAIPNHAKSKPGTRADLGDILTSWKFLLLVFALATSCLVIWSRQLGQACREEQFWCESSSLTQPLSAHQKGRHSGLALNIRYFGSVVVVVSFVFLLLRLLRRDGNLSGESLPVLVVKYAMPLAVPCLCLHWASHEQLPIWQQVFMPRGVYVVVLLVFLTMIWNPVLLYLVHFPRPEDGEATKLSLGKGSADDLIRAAYKRIKHNWKNHLKSTSQTNGGTAVNGPDIQREAALPPPHAYGLATAYSAAFLVLVANLFLLTAMLLGDGLVFSLASLLITMILWLEIYSATRWPRPEALQSATGSSFAAYLLIPWWVIVGWGFVSAVFYFDTGHQSSIPNIPWNAAFHGVVGDHSTNVIPALLVALNLYGADVISALALPLLALWPYARGKLVFYFSKRHVSPVVEQKCEVALRDNPRTVNIALLKLALGYLLFGSLRSLSAMAAAGLHRRHLMVWKIFAPRFIFESARYGVSGVCVLLGILFFQRVDRLVQNWLDSVQDRIAKK